MLSGEATQSFDVEQRRGRLTLQRFVVDRNDETN